MTQSRITQLGREVLVEPVPESRITQIGREVLVATDARSRFTQIGREVMIPFAAPIDLGGFGGQLWPRGGELFPESAGGDLDGNYPDPTVVGLKGVPMVGTLGANQVWSKDPVNDELIPTSVASGSTYTFFDPDKPPSSLVNSIKFDGTDPAPTTINIGTSTYDINTTKPRSLVIKPENNFGWRGLLWALPAAALSSDFTMWCRVHLMGHGNNYLLAGIALKDTTNPTTGRTLSWNFGYNSDTSLGHYGGYAEASTGFGVSGSSQPFQIRNANLNNPILAIRRVGTNYTVEVSNDGRTVSKSANIASTTIGGGSAWSPGYYGIACYRSTHSDDVSYTFGPVYLELSGTAAVGGDRIVLIP